MTRRSIKSRLKSRIRPGSTEEIDNLVRAIEDDHADLKRFIEIMKDDEEEPESIQEAAVSFMSLLRSHAPAEEKALYNRCLKVDELRQMASEGFVEHGLADRLMRNTPKTMPSPRGRDKWLAQVKVLAEIVEHHIEEEEEELLPAVRKHFGKQKQAQMAHEFIALRKRSQRDFSFDNAGVLRSA